MSYFENDENIEITQELLDKFVSDSLEYYDESQEGKTIEQIREERYIRQEERRLRKKQERRSAIVNSVMPFMAMVLLVCTVLYMNSLQFGLIISYNDEQIGVVENAGVVNEATGLIDSRIINKSLDSLEDEPQYRVAVVNNTSDFQTSTELSRSIIANDNVLADQICGVFVDGTFVGAVENEEDAREVLDELREAEKKKWKSLGNVDAVEFNSSVQLEVGLYARSSVVDKAEIKNRLENNVEISYKIIVLQEQNVKIKYKTEYVIDETKTDNYEQVTVKGQVGEGIATNRAVYVDGNQIMSEHIKVVATKKPVNEVITISPDNEHSAEVKSENNNTDKSNNNAQTNKTDENSDDSSKENTDAENGDDTNNSETADNETDNQNQDGESDNNNTQTVSSSQFIWPAPSCGYITNDFGYQGEKLHKGIDISGGGVEGQPILAAASGYVTSVVFDYSGENYGCYLIIDHGNGYQTLYAQCSDIYVSSGAYVEQGETVAAVGSTGDATGPHLHFEIISNGEYVNPTNYLY